MCHSGTTAFLAFIYFFLFFGSGISHIFREFSFCVMVAQTAFLAFVFFSFFPFFCSGISDIFREFSFCVMVARTAFLAVVFSFSFFSCQELLMTALKQRSSAALLIFFFFFFAFNLKTFNDKNQQVKDDVSTVLWSLSSES